MCLLCPQGEAVLTVGGKESWFSTKGVDKLEVLRVERAAKHVETVGAVLERLTLLVRMVTASISGFRDVAYC